MTRKACSEDGCEYPSYARGLCKVHYAKSRPQKPRKPLNRTKLRKPFKRGAVKRKPSVTKRFLDFSRTDYEDMTISELKKVADHRFRKYLLHKAERNSNNQVFCPITRQWFYENQLHVCHYIDRVKINTRYDEDNCVLGSAYSNTHDSKMPCIGYRSIHHRDFELFLGPELVEELKTKAQLLTQFNKNDYIYVINKYEI